MSTWFTQCLAYGYMGTIDEFDRIVGDKWYDSDNMDMLNNSEGLGWFVTDDFAFFGKLLIQGEDYGNDTILAAETGYVKFPRVDASDFSLVAKNVKEMFGEAKEHECDYYILGEYS
jgi:hypothetical protein